MKQNRHQNADEETGGEDTRLVVLEPLRQCRKKGWKVGASTYKIKVFAEVDFTNHDEVRQVIFADVGRKFSSMDRGVFIGDIIETSGEFYVFDGIDQVIAKKSYFKKVWI